MTKAQRKRRNSLVAIKARRHGARYAWSIATIAVEQKIPYAVAFANVEQESGFKNIFGHDAGGPFQGEWVTNARVSALLHHVHLGGTSNGVGLTQLTYPPFIEQAHKMRHGAAHVPNQLKVGFALLHDLRRQYGSWYAAFGAYNGGPNWRRSSAAITYAGMMDARVKKWEKYLKI